jgi:Phosphoserine phosphatase RsbU, N-terminal domain
VTEAVDSFDGRYGAALADHVRAPDETGLGAAYELGREAVSCELTVLELAVVHHDALASALASFPAEQGRAVTEAARDFFVESVSAFEMVRRGFREARDAALLEQRHAAILRQLSNFLADASVALDASGSIEEMLQLLVEQARELLGARGGEARLRVGDGSAEEIDVASSDDGGDAAEHDRLRASFVGWDGRELGTIEVFDKTTGEFGDVDAAVLTHLAQMASAALERARLYERG